MSEAYQTAKTMYTVAMAVSYPALPFQTGVMNGPTYPELLQMCGNVFRNFDDAVPFGKIHINGEIGENHYFMVRMKNEVAVGLGNSIAMLEGLPTMGYFDVSATPPDEHTPSQESHPNDLVEDDTKRRRGRFAKGRNDPTKRLRQR